MDFTYFINTRCKSFINSINTLLYSMIPILRTDCNADNESRTTYLIFIRKRHEVGFFSWLKEQNRKRFSEVTEAQKVK